MDYIESKAVISRGISVWPPEFGKSILSVYGKRPDNMRLSSKHNTWQLSDSSIEVLLRASTSIIPRCSYREEVWCVCFSSTAEGVRTVRDLHRVKRETQVPKHLQETKREGLAYATLSLHEVTCNWAFTCQDSKPSSATAVQYHSPPPNPYSSPGEQNPRLWLIPF